MVGSVNPTIGASATVSVFQNQRIRLIPNIAGAMFQVTYLATAAAAGLTHAVFVGAANPVERQPVSPINRFPQSPEDIVATFNANPGEEITVEVTETTAAPIAYTGKLVVTRIR
jgi:hypothetical protein